MHEAPLDVVPSGELTAPLDEHPGGTTEATNKLLVGRAPSPYILRQPDKLPTLAGGQKANPRFLLYVLDFLPGGNFIEDAKLPPYPDSEHEVYVLNGIKGEGGYRERKRRLRHGEGDVSGDSEEDNCVAIPYLSGVTVRHPCILNRGSEPLLTTRF